MSLVVGRLGGLRWHGNETPAYLHQNHHWHNSREKCHHHRADRYFARHRRPSMATSWSNVLGQTISTFDGVSAGNRDFTNEQIRTCRVRQQLSWIRRLTYEATTDQRYRERGDPIVQDIVGNVPVGHTAVRGNSVRSYIETSAHKHSSHQQSWTSSSRAAFSPPGSRQSVVRCCPRSNMLLRSSGSAQQHSRSILGPRTGKIMLPTGFGICNTSTKYITPTSFMRTCSKRGRTVWRNG